MAPDQMARVVTSINLADGALKILWAEPFLNGSPVTAYQVELKDYNGMWQSDTSCNGALATVISN
jgi:hypothetical protein